MPSTTEAGLNHGLRKAKCEEQLKFVWEEAKDVPLGLTGERSFLKELEVERIVHLQYSLVSTSGRTALQAVWLTTGFVVTSGEIPHCIWTKTRGADYSKIPAKFPDSNLGSDSI